MLFSLQTSKRLVKIPKPDYNEKNRKVRCNIISSKEKALSILSYFGPFFLLAVLLAPESHFAKYHANQGLVLFLTEVVVSTVIMVGRYIPLIGWTFQLLNIVIVVLFFLGLSHAIREVEEPLPFIGEIQILK